MKMILPIDLSPITEELIALGIFALIGFLIKEIFGHNVVVRKIKEKIIIDIPEEIQEKYNITSNNEPIYKLIQRDYKITNWGFRDIENFKVNIVTTRKYFKNKPVDFTVIDSKDSSTTTILHLDDYADGLTIERPFFNSAFKDKSEELIVQIISFADFDIKSRGGGKGWGITYKKSIKDIRANIAFSILMVLSSLFVLITILQYLKLSYYFLIPLGMIIYYVSFKLISKIQS